MAKKLTLPTPLSYYRVQMWMPRPYRWLGAPDFAFNGKTYIDSFVIVRANSLSEAWSKVCDGDTVKEPPWLTNRRKRQSHAAFKKNAHVTKLYLRRSGVTA